ncbi:MAG: choice-of-anchor D domain-containing protein [Deltaproteobacteria bacterium]|nr:choice-of-anchor D domain-containing protein [Deltaproteobacteria bacterium]
MISKQDAFHHAAWRRRRRTGLLAGLVLAGFGACRCQDEELNDLKPDVAVLPTPVDFQLRQVGADSSLPVRVVNRGTADLTLHNITVEPATAPYTVSLPGGTAYPFQVPTGEGPEAQVSIQVTFHPPTRGPHNAMLVVQSDDPDQGRLEVPLLGIGGPPRLRVTPDNVNFDLVNQGTPQSRTLELANIGLDTLHVTAVQMDPSSNPGFRLTPVNNFGSGDIPVGSTALVTVDMDPSVTGQATGLLHVLSDADGEPDKTVPIAAVSNLGPAVEVVEKVTRQADYRTDLYLTVTLDASGTVDAEADNFTLAWRVLERPPGSQSILENTTLPAEKQLYIDQVGIYRVEVTGTDVRGAVGKATATIRAIRDLALRLTWEPDPNAACRSAATPEYQCGKTDVDLHLVAPGGAVGDYFASCAAQASCSASCVPSGGATCTSQGLDCAYANRSPDWGTLASTDDDPRLDIDDAYGYGPENISLNNPVEGDYLVQVHFCNDRLQNEGAVAKVEVLFHGEQATPPFLGPVVLPTEGSLWLAGTVHYNPNAVAPASKFTLTPLGTATNPVIVDGAPNLCTQ